VAWAAEHREAEVQGSTQEDRRAKEVADGQHLKGDRQVAMADVGEVGGRENRKC
jgi:hypothetical protein